jgi:hypothetical protein
MAKTEAQLSQALQEADAKTAAVQDNESRWSYTPWLNRAGWSRHLKGLDRSWLLDMAQTPTSEERALRNVCWAVEMVIWKAQQASHSTVVGMPAMILVNRREYGNTKGEKPFNASQGESTMKKYSDLWVQIIAYILRTHCMSIVRPHGEEEAAQKKRPPYRLTKTRHKCLDCIKDISGYDDERAAGTGACAGTPDWTMGRIGIDGVDDNDEDDDELDEEQAEALQTKVLAFMLALLDRNLGDNEYQSALISGMAVLGVSAETGWLSPLMYTPKQSAIVTVSCMLVLYQASCERRRQIAKLVDGGYSEESAGRVAPTHFELVQEMCNHFMVITDHKHPPTPMNAVFRLLSFGYGIRYTTKAEGVVGWMGDTLLYGHIRFSMLELRCMVHGIISSVQQDIVQKVTRVVGSLKAVNI